MSRPAFHLSRAVAADAVTIDISDPDYRMQQGMVIAGGVTYLPAALAFATHADIDDTPIAGLLTLRLSATMGCVSRMSAATLRSLATELLKSAAEIEHAAETKAQAALLRSRGGAGQ